MITIFRLLAVTGLLAVFLALFAVLPPKAGWAFVDWPSLFFVVFGTGCLASLGCEQRDWRNTFRLVIGRLDIEDDERCRSAERFLAFARRGSIATGLTACLIGIICVLGNMDDPSILGPGLAVAMIPILYGIVLSEFVCTPLLAWVRR